MSMSLKSPDSQHFDPTERGETTCWNKGVQAHADGSRKQGGSADSCNGGTQPEGKAIQASAARLVDQGLGCRTIG